MHSGQVDILFILWFIDSWYIEYTLFIGKSPLARFTTQQIDAQLVKDETQLAQSLIIDL